MVQVVSLLLGTRGKEKFYIGGKETKKRGEKRGILYYNALGKNVFLRQERTKRLSNLLREREKKKEENKLVGYSRPGKIVDLSKGKMRRKKKLTKESLVSPQWDRKSLRGRGKEKGCFNL